MAVAVVLDLAEAGTGRVLGSSFHLPQPFVCTLSVPVLPSHSLLQCRLFLSLPPSSTAAGV